MNFAQQLVKKHKTNNPFIISKNIGINIRYADLGKQTRGIYHRSLNRRFIVIHNQLSEDWQRFICAHELGHDRLHKGINRFYIDTKTIYSSGKFEKQANEFAIQLLTASDTLQSDESLFDFLCRNGVPKEVHNFITKQSIFK